MVREGVGQAVGVEGKVDTLVVREGRMGKGWGGLGPGGCVVCGSE